MIRLGIISFAHMHAWSYAKHILTLPNATLVALADDDRDRGRAASDKLGVERLHGAHTDLLARETLDGVIVCSENAHHALHAIDAAQAGKHVLCEKPLATSPADAERMIRASSQNRVALMTAFPCRFHPAARRAAAAISGRQIGRVLAVNATNHGRNPGGWFVQPERSGGGAIADHTVHVVDLLRWMTGQEVTEVYAEGTNFNAQLSVEDGALLSFRFEDFVATLDASWSRPAANPVWGDVTLEVIGSEGVLSLDLFAQDFTVVRDREARVASENWGDDMDTGLVSEFVEAIESGREPAVTGLDGLRAVEVVEAAYRSVRSGMPQAVTQNHP
jgi:predicted dehydrogenase